MSDEFADKPDAHDADPWLEKVLRYFDGDLSTAELSEFNTVLRSDAATRRRFQDYCTQSSLIRETIGSERQAVQRREPYVSARMRPLAKSHRWLASIAAAVLLIALGGAGAWLLRSRPVQAEIIGTLEKIEGDVRVLGADGQARASAPNMRVRSGDTIRTHGAESLAVLAYPDGSRLALVGDANLTCTEAGHKNVVVHEGTVAGSVVRQPEGTPMLISTPSAVVEAPAAKFVIETQPDQTELKVTQGQATMVRASDGKRIDVEAGKSVLAKRNADDVPSDIRIPPDALHVDFNQGLPKGWTRGKFTADGLRAGVKGAIKAVPSEMYDDVFEIASPDVWFNGLFTVHEDSYISITMKMERPNWINIFVQARTIAPEDPASINYLYNDLRFYEFKPGQWRTVKIPLSKFGRAGYASAKRLKEEVPYRLLFSNTGQDRGLTIERIDIGRGAPPDVEYKDEQ